MKALPAVIQITTTSQTIGNSVMSRKKPAGPLETFIAIAVCFVPIALLVNAVGIRYEKNPSTPSPSPSTTGPFPLSEDDPSITVDSCRSIKEHNLRACVDFANWCYKWGEDVEKGNLSSTDEAITNCESRGWKYNKQNKQKWY